MQFTAQQVATLLKGNIEGNPDVVISQLAKIEEAQAGELSFLANPKYEHFVYHTKASVVVVNQDFEPAHPIQATLIRVKNAYSSFSELLSYYHQLKQERSGREQPSFVHETAQIGANEYIGAFSYIGKNVKIGKNTKIYPHVYLGDDVCIGDDTTLFSGVKIYSDCVIGNEVIIHAGTIIGSDGFGFAPQEDGTYTKIPQIGHVIIEDRVEIGANTVVDRATMGATIIRKGVKLDNLIQIAHNVEVGKNTVIAAQSGVAGSSKVGENVIVGGQVGIVGHLTVADRTQVQGQSGVNRSITVAGKKWGGTPSTLYQSQLRSQVIYARLPELEKRIAELEQLLLIVHKD